MDDKQIIDLYFERNEQAILHTQEKYGKYLESITHNILKSVEDSEECVNDTYHKLWETIPPQRPERLGSYAGKVARNIALNRYNFNNADKRNQNMTVALGELEDILGNADFAANTTQRMAFTKALNEFLRHLPEKKRNVFIMRYWYLTEVKDIAEKIGENENTVKTVLARLRERFKKYLEKEGIIV